MGVEKKH